MYNRKYNDTMCFLKPLVDPTHELIEDTGLINLYVGNVLRGHKPGECLVAHVVANSYAANKLGSHN